MSEKRYNCGRVIETGDLVTEISNDASGFFNCDPNQIFVVYDLFDLSFFTANINDLDNRKHRRVNVVPTNYIDCLIGSTILKKESYYSNPGFWVNIDNIEYLSRFNYFKEQIYLFDPNI